MPSLLEQIGSGDQRKSVIDDACQVLDQEVSDKGGLSGLAIKGAYKVVQGIRPGFIRETVDHLLDDFLSAVDPVYQEASEKKLKAGPYLEQNSSRVADALLAVTDKRAARAQSKVVKSAYEKLRPMAKKQVESATPRLSKLLEKHAAPTG
ncbi:MAG TPA: hypothetical protein VGI10_15980 [Polyangiaceae bacterium]|jgi:hypothetical protein